MAVRRNQLDKRRRVVRMILRWYALHGRILPWRNIRDPYRLLVAEIMLHQTQVRRVLELYPVFLRRFPTVAALARARQSDVVVAWRGLGYNNRAVRLHRLAGLLADRSGGRLPAGIDELERLPGIGRYTAHALWVSIHRKDLPVVDVNVRRVLSRIFRQMPTTAALMAEHEIWDLASTLVPRGKGYEWMQALMDLGSGICTARAPECAQCPVWSLCLSGAMMTRVRPARPAAEPSMDGIPNRIYRGRIVEKLRQSSGRSGMGVLQIGKTIHPAFTRRHRAWLRQLLDGLARDGVIRLRQNGPFERATVRLA
jgi:A/G-specific adenine glycosylase